jgi:hypothetical protein
MIADHFCVLERSSANAVHDRLGLYSKRPEWTQPENLDALFIGISEIVDNSKPEIV